MKKSAGLLLYRTVNQETEFFLVHPGGPFFVKKNEGYWTIPKGEIMDNEDPLAAALREFEEETSYRPAGEFIPLTPVIQKGGKEVQCWAVKGTLEASDVFSNTFELEWPPKSGRIQTYPEIDRGGWYCYQDAATLINERQKAFLDELALLLKGCS